jgi:hypothetical protein
VNASSRNSAIRRLQSKRASFTEGIVQLDAMKADIQVDIGHSVNVASQDVSQDETIPEQLLASDFVPQDGDAEVMSVNSADDAFTLLLNNGRFEDVEYGEGFDYQLSDNEEDMILSLVVNSGVFEDVDNDGVDIDGVVEYQLSDGGEIWNLSSNDDDDESQILPLLDTNARILDPEGDGISSDVSMLMDGIEVRGKDNDHFTATGDLPMIGDNIIFDDSVEGLIQGIVDDSSGTIQGNFFMEFDSSFDDVDRNVDLYPDHNDDTASLVSEDAASEDDSRDELRPLADTFSSRIARIVGTGVASEARRKFSAQHSKELATARLQKRLNKTDADQNDPDEDAFRSQALMIMKDNVMHGSRRSQSIRRHHDEATLKLQQRLRERLTSSSNSKRQEPPYGEAIDETFESDLT